VRITFRSTNAKAAWQSLQALAAASTPVSALVGASVAPEAEDIAILDAGPERVAEARLLAQSLRSQDHPPVMVLAAAPLAFPPPTGFGDGGGLFDGWLPLDNSPVALGRQVDRAKRLASARYELSSRRRTAERLRIATPAAGPARKLKVIYIGAPQPFFLSLERWTHAHDGVLTAAFTSFSGFDHLHDEAYDAAVLNAQEDPQTALTICGALRRNAGLHHLPTFVITAPGDEATKALAFERGASVVSSGEDPISLNWLFEAIRVERARAAVERGLFALRDQMGEPRAGLFRPNAFLTHLDTLCADHADGSRALSLVALQMLPLAANAPLDTGDWALAVTEAASLVGRLIRASDCATLIDDTIVLALTCTNHAGACKTVDRIVAVTDCTSFAGADAAAGGFVIAHSVIQQDPGEAAGALLERLLSPFTVRSLRA
jgi:two-component system cell cycle response regulator PopA